MTIAANRHAPLLTPGSAHDTLREMAAVIRTVFGVGLQASRQAAAMAAEAAPYQVEAAPTADSAAVTTGSIPVPGITPGAPVAEAVNTVPASIPMPSIPLPELPSEALTEDAPEAVTEDVPTTYDVPTPAVAPILLAVPELDVSDERRSALLQELAFLDD